MNMDDQGFDEVEYCSCCGRASGCDCEFIPEQEGCLVHEHKTDIQPPYYSAERYTAAHWNELKQASIELEITNLCFDAVRGHHIDIGRAEKLMKDNPSLYKRISDRERQQAQDEKNPLGRGYTRKPVDAIVTSPPFSEARHDDTDRAKRANDGRLPRVGDAAQ